MSKGQTDRLSEQHEQSGGPKGIFGKNAQKHDSSVKEASKIFFKKLTKEYSQFEFRHRDAISKKGINDALRTIDSR